MVEQPAQRLRVHRFAGRKDYRKMAIPVGIDVRAVGHQQLHHRNAVPHQRRAHQRPIAALVHVGAVVDHPLRHGQAGCARAAPTECGTPPPRSAGRSCHSRAGHGAATGLRVIMRLTVSKSLASMACFRRPVSCSDSTWLAKPGPTGKPVLPRDPEQRIGVRAVLSRNEPVLWPGPSGGGDWDDSGSGRGGDSLGTAASFRVLPGVRSFRAERRCTDWRVKAGLGALSADRLRPSRCLES